MSTYWPGQQKQKPEMNRLCRFCGFHERTASRFVNGCEDNPGGHEYVEVNKHRVGPVGPGTPAARMEWLWEALRPYEHLLARVGYNPISSGLRDSFDYAIVRFFEAADKTPDNQKKSSN